MNSFYNSDLARIHDQNFSSLAIDAASFLLKSVNADQKKMVDLGCGSGTLARILSDSGFQVTGVDYSADMIALAQKNVPQVPFIQSSIFDYQIPKCDTISLLGEVICYLFDHRNDQQHLTSLFEKCYKSLNPQGLLVFDFLTPEVVTDGHLARRFIERENWSMFVALDRDASNTILTRDITLFYREGELYRRSQETHRQRLFDATSVQEMLEEIGFSTEILDSYSEEKFRTGHVGMLCRKKQSLQVSSL